MAPRLYRPVVAVTGPEHGGLAAWLFTALAIRWAGGRPVRITPRNHAADQPFDALVIGGGADVGPMPIEETEMTVRTGFRWGLLLSYLLAPLLLLFRILLRRPWSQQGDRARDRLEYALLSKAERYDLPVLGICRGSQLLNAFAGGSLDPTSTLYAEAPTLWTILPVKCVNILAHSRLESILGAGQCTVNSLHLQAVNQLGRGLTVVGRDTYGVVQAIECPARRFWIGVQWHPEYLLQRREQRALFRALVDAASTVAAHRSVDTSQQRLWLDRMQEPQEISELS